VKILILFLWLFKAKHVKEKYNETMKRKRIQKGNVILINFFLVAVFVAQIII